MICTHLRPICRPTVVLSSSPVAATRLLRPRLPDFAMHHFKKELPPPSLSVFFPAFLPAVDGAGTPPADDAVRYQTPAKC